MLYKIAFIANNPGGLNSILPVAKKFNAALGRDIEIDFFCSFEARTYMYPQKFNVIFMDENSNETCVVKLQPKKYQCLIAATSITGNLEKTFVRVFKKNGVKTYSILDHSKLLLERYTDKAELDSLPDKIYSPDLKTKKKLKELSLGQTTVTVIHNPAFDALFDREIKSNKKKIHDQNYIIFASEPFSSDFPETSSCSELTSLDYLCKALKLANENFMLIVRPHPREEKKKFLPVLKKHGIPYKFDEAIDKVPGLLSSNAVYGFDSNLLVESSILGIPTYSIQINCSHEFDIDFNYYGINQIINFKDLIDSIEHPSQRVNETFFDKKSSAYIYNDVLNYISIN